MNTSEAGLAHVVSESEFLPEILTRAAVGLRVTMIIGQIGRYLEIRRAE